jgi:hypothetical protein
MPVKFMAGSVFRFVLRNDACHDVRDCASPSELYPPRTFRSLTRSLARSLAHWIRRHCHGLLLVVCWQLLVPVLPTLLDTFFSMLGELGVEDVRLHCIYCLPSPLLLPARFLTRSPRCRCDSRAVLLRSDRVIAGDAATAVFKRDLLDGVPVGDQAGALILLCCLWR